MHNVISQIEDMLYTKKPEQLDKNWPISLSTWDGIDCSSIGLLGVIAEYILENSEEYYEREYNLENIGRLINNLEDILKRGYKL